MDSLAIGDSIRIRGWSGRFVIVRIDDSNGVADVIRPDTGISAVMPDVPVDLIEMVPVRQQQAGASSKVKTSPNMHRKADSESLSIELSFFEF